MVRDKLLKEGGLMFPNKCQVVGKKGVEVFGCNGGCEGCWVIEGFWVGAVRDFGWVNLGVWEFLGGLEKSVVDMYPLIQSYILFIYLFTFSYIHSPTTHHHSSIYTSSSSNAHPSTHFPPF